MKLYWRLFFKSSIVHVLKITFCSNRKKTTKQQNRANHIGSWKQGKHSSPVCITTFALFDHVNTAKSMLNLSNKDSPSDYNDESFYSILKSKVDLENQFNACIPLVDALFNFQQCITLPMFGMQ